MKDLIAPIVFVIVSILGFTGCPLDTPPHDICSWTAPGGDRQVDPQNGGTILTDWNKGHWPIDSQVVAAQCWGFNIFYGCIFWAARYSDLAILYGPVPTQEPCL